MKEYLEYLTMHAEDAKECGLSASPHQNEESMPPTLNDSPASEPYPSKTSRNAKKKAKKEAELEAIREQARQDASKTVDWKQLENEALSKQLIDMKKEIVEV